VTIGVTDVRANLAAVVLRFCEKFCALGLPLSIGPRNIRDPNVRNALVRSGSGGVVKVTVGLSALGSSGRSSRAGGRVVLVPRF